MLEQADILIDLEQQLLYLPQHNKLYVISSGKNGIGEQENRAKHLEAGIELLKSLVNICLSILFLLHGSRQVKFIPHHWHNRFRNETGFYLEFFG
jgi:hypothetical protein